MLLIRTTLRASPIHGIGVFAAEPVSAGAPVWRFAPGLDQVVPLAMTATLPEAFRDYLATYAYRSPEYPDSYVLSCDHAKFLNHADDPNTAYGGPLTVAARSIAAGDEITCDYGSCVLGWTGFD